MIAIASDSIEAGFTPWRAELVSLRDRKGRQFLWGGDPQFWSGRSPLLFPIVGMVPGDGILIGGKEYGLPQHGFAPHREFSLISSGEAGCHFRLESDDETRSQYPFEFALDVHYEVAGKTLSMRAVVSNRSDTAMPFSFGFHPGFAWPLPDAGPREGHALTFERAENAPIRRPLNGLLDAREFPNPIVGRRLALHDQLFVPGAMMFDAIASRGLRFGSGVGPCLDIEWRGLSYLGVWTKPGAGFVCVEPWQGLPAPVGYFGELAAKPGIVSLPTGASREFAMSITLLDRTAS